jgi:S1-C subfamily serine protease
MKKLIIFLIIILFSNNINSQTSQPLVTDFPSIEDQTYSQYVEFSFQSIIINEFGTLIRLKIKSKINNGVFKIPSNTIIQFSENAFDNIRIEGIVNNELDKVYSTGKKGTEMFLDLMFDRIPPGIKNINLFADYDGQLFYWKGIKINNSYNHPNTNLTEKEIKLYLDNSNINIEGIYESIETTTLEQPKYKIAIKKENDRYQIIYLSGSLGTTWVEGEIKGYLNETATPNLYKTLWYMQNKTICQDNYITFENGLMKMSSSNSKMKDSNYLKLYPKSNNNIKSSGTGFAISSNGVIITNNHVIDGANKIIVKGLNGDFSMSYSAKVLVTDKTNDLAIIKIDDVQFKNISKLPYTIKTKLSDVGENIFVLGFPLRATMGEEIKLTNGLISSKTGFQGDITTYQVSAPVQPGNSGGPVFDKEGNIIGIIKAKHQLAENVSYAIKSSYLINLLEILDPSVSLPLVNILHSKTLSQQVELAKKFVYIVEVY